MDRSWGYSKKNGVIAIENGHLKLLDQIKSISPKLFSIRNNEGFTPAGLACKLGKLRILQWTVVNSPEPVIGTFYFHNFGQ